MNFAPKITLYGPNGTSLGSAYGDSAATVTRRATLSGNHYAVVEDYWASYNGNYRLTLSGTLTPPSGPRIVSQPMPQAIPIGSSAYFRVEAIGTGPLDFQWRKNGMDITGANDSTLTLNTVGIADSGAYTVIVHNSADSVTSAVAQLEVLPPPGHTVPLPPQKIFLAFGQPSTFALFLPAAFGKAWPFVISGSIPAASVPDSYRNNVTSQIKDIFLNSAVKNIEWTTAESDDAIAVYFCPTNPYLFGYSKPPVDRFNSKRRGEVIVFVNETLPNLDAETAAHEIGHALGLRHVNPPVATDPFDDEVMDIDFSASPRFINVVSPVTDITSFSTHNPLYHLLRYVDGWSSAQLQNAAINPGTWDTGSTITTRLFFQNENLRLFNITVFSAGENAESSFALEQIASATLGELSERTFAVPEGLGIVLLASTTTNGPPDVISSTRDPFSSLDQILSPGGTNTFSLFRQDSQTHAVEISAGFSVADSQSLICNILMSGTSILRIDFRGTLQSSTNLLNWTDVGANTTSPEFVLFGPNESIKFFRTKR